MLVVISVPSLPNVEAQTPEVTVFGDEALGDAEIEIRSVGPVPFKEEEGRVSAVPRPPP